MKLSAKPIIFTIIGFATFYCFLSLIGYVAAYIIDTKIFRVYFKDLVGFFDSTIIKKTMLYIFWLPAEALIVIITVTVFSYFFFSPSNENRIVFILSIVIGALLSDIFWSHQLSEYFMSYFPATSPYGHTLSLLINTSLWATYSYIAFSILSLLKENNNRS